MLTDTDTATSTTVNYWTLNIDNREDNSLGFNPPDNDYRFGLLDCQEGTTLDFTVSLDDTVETSGKRIYLYAGESCDTVDGLLDCILLGDSDGYAPVAGKSTYIEGISVLNVFGLDAASACTDITSGVNTYMWLALLDEEGIYDSADDNGDLMDKVPNRFELDVAAPSVPAQVTGATIGNKKVSLTWVELDDSDIDGYAAVAAAGCGTLVEGATLDAGAVTQSVVKYSNDTISSLVVDNLENGTAYDLAVVTLDDSGNPSVLSNVTCATPAKSTGFGENLNTDGEYCFIATAAFGSYDHPTVRLLRSFRDQFLLKIPGVGRLLVNGYYTIGPTMAQGLYRHADLRPHLQAALSLFAGLSIFLVQQGPFAVLGLLILALLVGVAIGLKKNQGVFYEK